eukprot:1139155-Pelagomonas_calceolata.AAC.1
MKELSTRSTKFEDSITLKNGARGHDKCVHVMLYTSVLGIHCHRCIAMLREVENSITPKMGDHFESDSTSPPVAIEMKWKKFVLVCICEAESNVCPRPGVGGVRVRALVAVGVVSSLTQRLKCEPLA